MMATILGARWIVLRLVVPVASARLGMGFIALLLLLIAEFGFVLWLRGLTIREYSASRNPVSGTVYYVILAMFAAMPLLVR
jgi:type IV secretory pathway TrbD component